MRERSKPQLSTVAGWLLILLLLGPVDARATEPSQVRPAVLRTLTPLSLERFGEELYEEFEEATGRAAQIAVQVTRHGALSELAGAPLGQQLQLPNHRIQASVFGVEIRKPVFAPPALVPYPLPDLGYKVDQFEALGYPVDMGEYRKLLISVTIDEERRQHEALELCWSELSRCVVIDPAMVHVQSMVSIRLRLLAMEWGPTIEFSEATRSGEGSDSGACALRMHPEWNSILYRWRPWSATFRDSKGSVLVYMEMGEREAGIRCVGTSKQTCRPTHLGENSSSSCRGEGGHYTCHCQEAVSFSSSGHEARAMAESWCKLSSTEQGVHQNAREFLWDLTGETTGHRLEVGGACVWSDGSAPGQKEPVADLSD